MVTPNLLSSIRKHPSMFFGECSLSALYHFMAGYMGAVAVHGIKTDTTFQLPSDFHDWVAYRLHYESSTSGWKDMILGVSRDETTAFARFFELLDEHATRKSRVIAKLIGYQGTYTISSGGQTKIERYPSCILLIVYTDDPGFFAVSDEPGYTMPMKEFFPSWEWFEDFMGVTRSQMTIVDAETFGRLSK